MQESVPPRRYRRIYREEIVQEVVEIFSENALLA